MLKSQNQKLKQRKNPQQKSHQNKKKNDEIIIKKKPKEKEKIIKFDSNAFQTLIENFEFEYISHFLNLNKLFHQQEFQNFFMNFNKKLFMGRFRNFKISRF